MANKHTTHETFNDWPLGITVTNSDGTGSGRIVGKYYILKGKWQYEVVSTDGSIAQKGKLISKDG